MKKFLELLFVFIISMTSAFCAEMRFVQIDSLCFSAQEESSVVKFEKLIKDINKQKNIEFIVFTGDNIANPNKENLEQFLKTAKDLKRPYYMVLGSKDINKQKHMSKKYYVKTVQSKNRAHKKIEQSNYSIEKKGMVFIVLDGSKEVITTPMGYYRETTLDWLENELSFYRDKNVVIFQHYPLIPPSNKESRYTIKPERYLDLLKNYKNVKAIFAGNFDINSEKNIDGILHITTANAPKYRIVDVMDCETENPTFWSIIKE